MSASLPHRTTADDQYRVRARAKVGELLSALLEEKCPPLDKVMALEPYYPYMSLWQHLQLAWIFCKFELAGSPAEVAAGLEFYRDLTRGVKSK